MTVADDRAVDENAAATKQTAAAGRGPRVVFSHQAVYELVGNAAAIACDTAGIAGIANEDAVAEGRSATGRDGTAIAGAGVGAEVVETGEEDNRVAVLPRGTVDGLRVGVGDRARVVGRQARGVVRA